MPDPRYLLESSATDGYLLEDGSGVLLLDASTIAAAGLASGTGEALGAGVPSITASAGLAAGTAAAYDAAASNSTSDDLILVIVDRNWNRLILSRNVLQLEIDEELGSAENKGTVAILATDPAAAYVPNPDTDSAEPTRFQVYLGNTLAFAGLIDKTTSRVDAEGILTFGGIQRGGELAERNFGRRDLLAWPLPEVFRELLRDNIGRAPFATATDDWFDLRFGPINAITGDPQPEQYWSVPFNANRAGLGLIGKYHREITVVDLTIYNDDFVLQRPYTSGTLSVTVNGVDKTSDVFSQVPAAGTFSLATSVGNGDIIVVDYNSPNDITLEATPETLTIDLGSIQSVDAIRVISEWATGKWYTWILSTSEDGAAYTQRYDYNQHLPTGDRGTLVELGGVQARYVKLLVNGSYDGYPRIASVLTYQNLAELGGATTYSVPWIENDDSGNITLTGPSQRVIVDGAFAGDGILGNSFVTQLQAVSGSMTHTFRGTSNAVFFTESGSSTVDFYVDAVLQAADVTIPANSYQYKGFEVIGLPVGQHTLQVTRKAGLPQVDYFSGEYQSSYRIIQEDARTIGYTGPWNTVYGDGFSSQAVRSATVSGSTFQFPFYGDSLKATFSFGPSMGKFDWYLDGAYQAVVDLYDNNAYQDFAIAWSGPYGPHLLRVAVRSDKNGSSTGTDVQLDTIEGDWAHNIYLRSASDTNLALIGRLSEMTNTFLRLNYDGTVDLLGAIGSDSGEIIREGENEGGNIEDAEVEGEWSNAVSAILALGRGSDNQTLRVFVQDKEAVARLGVKVAKIENRDAVDAYLLVRQAWQILQDSKYPRRNYRVTWGDDR